METKKTYIVSFEIESYSESSVYQMVHEIAEDYRTQSFSIIDKTDKEYPGTFAKGGSCVNTGRTIKMSELMVSSDITDQSIITIFDADGKFLVEGNWFEDKILAYADCQGIARKIGSGLGVSFNLK